jgi:deoxyribodipyrimidine photolyase-like uncharacterized protein
MRLAKFLESNQSMATKEVRTAVNKQDSNLVFILGDQLDAESTALTDFNLKKDTIFMAEVAEESEHVWSSKPRTAFFLSSMRHFADQLRKRGYNVDYAALGTHEFATLASALDDAITRHQPNKVVMVEPGDYRVEQSLRAFCSAKKVELAKTAIFCCRAESSRSGPRATSNYAWNFFIA